MATCTTTEEPRTHPSSSPSVSAGSLTTSAEAQAQSQESEQQKSTESHFPCRWGACGEKYDSAADLYEHVCESHVGRKINADHPQTCQWTHCRISATKRYHLTSHIRVHVPWKPHKCDYCETTFKRPQDLKKHIKLPRSIKRGNWMDGVPSLPNVGLTRTLYSEPRLSRRRSLRTCDLLEEKRQANLSVAMDFFGGNRSGVNGYSTYNTSSNGMYPGSGVPAPRFSAINSQTAMDTERSDFDILNNFLQEAKYSQLEPSNYQAIQRLLAAYLPPLTGGANANPSQSYRPTPHTGYGSTTSQTDSQPRMPGLNLQSKSGLQDIDSTLEQMQSMAYKSSNAGSFSQPNNSYTHSDHTGFSPKTNHVSSIPAWKPVSDYDPKSLDSFLSENSKLSLSRHTSGSTGSYPMLPSISNDTLLNSLSNAAAAASNNSLNNPQSRPSLSTQLHPSYSKERSLSTSGVSYGSSAMDLDQLGLGSTPNSNGSGGGSSTNEATLEHIKEVCLENIRVIAELRSYIAGRLARREYEDERMIG